MRKVFLFMVFFVFVFHNTSKAQFKIKGKVVTKQNSPLAYGEVILFSQESVQLKTILTDEMGEFSIETIRGEYKLEINQFKQVLFTKNLELSADINLGIVEVAAVNDLGIVNISKRRPIVERKIDRLVFNVENTINSVGGDALEALKITPGISVRNETVTIIGKQSVRVLVDDKVIELATEDLASFLRSIPADNIKSIEVITNPPARYDAAGGSGLINIRLKKAQADTWNLSLGTSYLLRQEKGEGGVTGNFMYNKNKLSLSSSLNYRNGGESYNYQDYMTFPSELWNTKQVFRRDYKRLNGVLGAQVVAMPKWVIGFQYIANINRTNATRNTKSLVYVANNNKAFNEILALNTAVQKPEFNSLNLYNEIKIDTAGKKIILNLDYFKYNNNDTRPYIGTSVIDNPYSIQYFRGINDNAQVTNNYAGKIDVELPSKWANWSAGTKISISETDNKILAFNSGLVNASIKDMPQIGYRFNYKEDVQALYFSGNKKFNSKFDAQIGLRMEATQTKSFNAHSNQYLAYNYTKLFPTINLAYVSSENSTYRFSYGRRLARPNYAELNPNVTYITPFLTVRGNQLLRPYFVDNFELIYSYKKLESNFFYSAEKDVFNQIALPDLNNNDISLVYQNIYNFKRYGFIETYTFDKIGWWSSNNLLNINYLTTKTIALSANDINGLNAYFRSNNDFNLTKAKTFLFNLSFDYFIAGNYGIDKIKPFTITSFAIQYLLLGKDLRINFRANDIFKTDKYRFASTINGVHRNSNYYFDSRQFQLSINYKFGSNKVNIKKRQTANEDERARTGN
ncbi:TonB-dependent receptor [Pedobacter aquatilis]|uniref:TonB-dependent receptor n=1 Tax=Pedobacter aquatilis TaxID=351343 RepID=UPI00292F3570|nr:TonB-dependent receptor [Pedobacter aquatilis]